MTNKLDRKEFLSILTEQLATEVTSDVRITKKLANEVFTAVEKAFDQAITVEQAEVSLGSIGKFKPEIKAAAQFRNPQFGNPDFPEAAEFVSKPERLTVKFTVGGTYKKAVEATEI